MSDRSPRPHDDDDAPQRRRRPRRRPSTQRPEDDDIQSEKTRPTPDASRRRPKRRPTDEASSSRPTPDAADHPKRRRSSSKGDQTNQSSSRAPRRSDRSRNPAQASSGQKRRSKPRPDQDQPQQRQRRSQSSRDRAEASGANQSRVPRSSKRKSRSREDAANRSVASHSGAANASGTHSARRKGGSGRGRGGRRGAKKGGSNKFLIIGIIGFVVFAGGAIGGVAVWRIMNPPPEPVDPINDSPGTVVDTPKDTFIVADYKIGDRPASEILAELKDDNEDNAALAAEARDIIAAEIEKEPRLALTVANYIYSGMTTDTLADRMQTLKTVMNAPLDVSVKSDHLARFVYEHEGELTMQEETLTELATLIPQLGKESFPYIKLYDDRNTDQPLKLLLIEYFGKNMSNDPAVTKYFKDVMQQASEKDIEGDDKLVELVKAIETSLPHTKVDAN